jgi:membrane peptidoglycan carboxypeptidase
MKRIQRINRVSRKRPPRQSKLLPIAIIIVAGAFSVQMVLMGALFTAAGASAIGYYHNVTTQGLVRLRHAPTLVNVQPTTILDRHGRVLWKISDSSRGLHRNVPLAQIPLYMKEAVIATEDKTFYTNPGFEPNALVRALLIDLQYHGAVEGASGITQQIVKQQVLSNQRSVQRKLQEILIAYAVSRPHSGFTKNDILSLYLNTVYFGHQAYGVEAAARVFFGKDVWTLDLAQCAFLAGLVQAPSAYDPLGPNGPALARARMHEVLNRMLAQRYITPGQLRAALAEGDRFVFSIPRWRLTTSRSLAPYWTDWIKHLLTYGPAQDSSWYTDPTLAAIVARAGGLAAGLTIKTTLDLDMYRHAEQIMNSQVSYLAGNNVSDAAVVTLDPKTAECLAMVGGLDYYSSASGSQYNMAAVPRSPGSSFKAYTYVTAFEQGWYPAKIVLDTPQTWPDGSEPGGVYAPSNYDRSWHGALTVRMALANSYNVPAVKTIAAIGVAPVLKTAQQMGVWNLRGRHAGLALTLGSIPVPLWQMAQAYNTFANGGVFRPMASILSIKDAQGTTLYTYHPPRGVQVVAPQYAYLITSILKDNYARQLAFGVNSVLQLDRPAAAKTGTSQFFKDNLTIGYTPNLLTATWVGNADDSPMNNIEGIDGAGPIWHDMMEWSFSHLNLPVQDFVPPPGVMLARVSSAGDYVPNSCTAWSMTDVFAAGTLPHVYDPCTEDNHLRERAYANDFSLDGGTTGNTLGAPALLKPLAGQTPLAGVPGAPLASGSSGLLSQRPTASMNLCGGRYYTYQSVYVNGQLEWRYTCH